MIKKSTLSLALLSVWLSFPSCTPEDESRLSSVKKAIEASDQSVLMERGGYLVNIGGCNDCHSPKTMTSLGPAVDSSRLLSGHNPARPFIGYDKKVAFSGRFVIFNAENTAFSGPWGVSFASNLTPHNSGIGSWTLTQFGLALRKGKYKGLENSRTLLPPMPWQNYTNMSDEDVKAIYTYLMSVKPVDNVVPVPEPPKI